MARVGYGKVAAARDLHPSGFEEVLVHRPEDLDGIDPSVQAARVGGTVGGRKRVLIHERADELGIRVLNRRRESDADYEPEENGRPDFEVWCQPSMG